MHMYIYASERIWHDTAICDMHTLTSLFMTWLPLTTSSCRAHPSLSKRLFVLNFPTLPAKGGDQLRDVVRENAQDHPEGQALVRAREKAVPYFEN